MLRPLKLALAAGLALAALCSAYAQTPAPSGPTIVALDHVTVIDGTGAAPQPNTTVVIRDRAIQAVYPSGSRPMPTGARVDDLTGKFLVPGLFDVHVHITGRDTPLAQLQALLRGLVLHGITGIRDMAGDARILNGLAREAQLGTEPWANVYFSALMAGPSFFAVDPRVPGTTKGVMLGGAPWMRAVDQTTNLPIAIAEAKGTGATGIKIYANLPGAMLKAIAKEAHRQGLMVWTHGTVFPATPGDEVDAGADTISHTPYLVWQAAPRVPDSYQSRARGDFTHIRPDDPKILQLLDDMKAHGTILDATLRVFEEESRRDPDAMGAGIMPWSYAVTREAHERGVLVDTGTDSQGLPFTAQGPDLQGTPPVIEELRLLVDHAGFTPLDAIRAATQVSAMAVGQGALRGTVTPGKAADLVILSADPSSDIRNITNVVEVYKDGRKVEP
jgi:imidazolonepropionase-like amidohydrolase